MQVLEETFLVFFSRGSVSIQNIRILMTLKICQENTKASGFVEDWHPESYSSIKRIRTFLKPGCIKFYLRPGYLPLEVFAPGYP